MHYVKQTNKKKGIDLKMLMPFLIIKVKQKLDEVK